MIIVMKKNADDTQINAVKKKITSLGLKHHLSKGSEVTIIGVIGDERKLAADNFQRLPGVEKIMRVLKPYKLASRDFHPEETIINMDGLSIGGKRIIVMAGPCSVESKEQIIETAEAVKASGASILRGGAFKPRSSPYSFQGMGEEGLRCLAEAKKKTGLPIITEILDTDHLEMIEKYADILQIGARNMQNFNLLKAVGRSKKPVMLKRGLAATVKDLLMAAEYIMSEGNKNVILCERGIRTFETATRFTLDLNAIPLLKGLTHLPVIVDPSHGTGNYNLVTPMAKAAIASGADGLMIEVHPDPEYALSDGPQSLTPKNFSILMEEIKKIAKAIGRSI